MGTTQGSIAPQTEEAAIIVAAALLTQVRPLGRAPSVELVMSTYVQFYEEIKERHDIGLIGSGSKSD